MTQPNQAALESYAQQIVRTFDSESVTAKRVRGTDPNVDSFTQILMGLTNIRTDLADVEKALAPVKGYGTDDARYPYAMAFESLCSRMVDVVNTTAALSAKLDVLIAEVKAK